MKRYRTAVAAVVTCLLLALAGRAQPTGQDDLRQGLVALNKNDLAQARASLERAAKLDPQSALVWVALAQTYLKSGQKDLAVQAAARAEQFGADTPAVQHALALFFAGTGDLAKAADWERRFAATPGAGSQAATDAAALSLDAGQPEEAVKWAEAAVRGADTPEAHHVLGKAYRAAGRPDSGLPELRRAFELAPAQELFMSDFGQALLEHGDFAEALALLEKGQRQFPKNPQIVLDFGVACYAQRRPDDAVSAFLAVIRLDDTIEQPYVFLGRILEHAGGRLPEILAAYAAWEKKEPENYLRVFLHAKALAASSNPDAREVESRLRRSIERNGAFWESHLELGAILSGEGEWPEAERELERSIALAPGQTRPHYELARVYLRMGKPDLARAERAEYERLKSAESGEGRL
jgi:tetratricopeptide (TPR) repeat protein